LLAKYKLVLSLLAGNTMPEFVISLNALKRNAQILRDVADASGCQIVMALKGFSTWSTFPTLQPYLDGCCASGLWEAQLARQYFNKEILTYAPAYSDSDFQQLLEISNHLDFNSVTQWCHFREALINHPRFQAGELKSGLRINPQFSTGHTAIYDPCAPGSRLGIPLQQLEELERLHPDALNGISGFHMHTLCEQGAEDLVATVRAMEEQFGKYLSRPEFTWINLGGGHWITKPDYNRRLLVETIQLLRDTYNVDVWLEPGEAVAIHTGVLRAHVLDTFAVDGVTHAILDVSASAHMPDVLEMPYRPDVFLAVKEQGQDSGCTELSPALRYVGESYQKAGEAQEQAYTYRLGAATCLAGDIIGDFSFARPLQVGDTLVFDDMAHYTMVKTSFFNGVQHPDIVLMDEAGTTKTVRTFSYEDFRSRLG
jgi:carboxynorspermidine decarboxylase